MSAPREWSAPAPRDESDFWHGYEAALLAAATLPVKVNTDQSFLVARECVADAVH